MMKLLAAVRSRMRCGAARRAEKEEWKPVSTESPGRRLTAPSHWLCGVTDVGKRRMKNEDEYFLSTDCRLWIVADGMGGHRSGEVASALTIQAIAESMDRAHTDPGHDGQGSVGDRLVGAFSAAQDRVLGKSEAEQECKGMGSTAIAGFMDGDALHVCHIGDTRGYRFSEGRLTRLTNDHS